MARIRTIKPEFPQSESIGRLSRDARLLFIQIWGICDDHGKARASSRMLASLLYPYDEDARGLIPGWLDELEREGCIIVYEVDGNSYLRVEKWASHQKVDKPSQSKFPNPPDDFAKAREASRLTRLGPKDRDQGPKDPVPTSSGADAQVEDLTKVVFTQGLGWLVKMTGKTEDACRKILGRWRKDHGDEAVISAIGAAQRKADREGGLSDVVGWVEAALRERARQRPVTTGGFNL
jgi:hypothetical protein